MGKSKKNPSAKLEQFVDFRSPKAITEFIKDAKKFIEGNNLLVKQGDDAFPTVEAWQYIGENMGIFAMVNSVEILESPDELTPQRPDGKTKRVTRCRAEVTLHALDDNSQILGQGFAVCSSEEAFFSDADESAVFSMAQTRAIAKAYSNRFRWLMPLAGLKPTPSEEMLSPNAQAAMGMGDKPAALGLEEMKAKLGGKLALMDSDTKFRLLRRITGTSLLDKLTEHDWRKVYKELFENDEPTT